MALAIPSSPKIFAQLGRVYLEQKNYQQAEIAFVHALTIYEQQETPDPSAIVGILYALTRLSREQDDHQQTIIYGERAILFCQQEALQESTLLAECLEIVAECYFSEERYNEAKACYQRSFQIIEQAYGSVHQQLLRVRTIWPL